MPSIAIVNDPASDTWYEYLQVEEFLSTFSLDDVTSTLGHIETKVETQGWYAVGYVSYEAAPAFERSLPVRSKPKMPLVCFGLFKSRRPMIFSEHLAAQVSSPWLIDICQADYRAKLEQLDRGIRVGDYYQVNYTTRCRAKIENGWAMFQRLRHGASHGAYLNFENFEIVSASPELFFSLRNKTIVSKPMKGTVSRGQDEVEDESNYQWLLHSSKNRAENLMITDMVRNDLARIPGVEAIRVPELFSIEKFPTVWQMTSTVQASAEVGVVEIFRAMFPAASITGAPKQASMKYIATNEDTPREVYTGAIGVIAPNRQAHFNVAIRTAIISKDSYMASFGVGG
ncbi:MAG: aminodeoxychorismate synthase, component I, partial [Gammaproteobacteria bacterium]|nr:aminodeoxychorismate synthase, component I [Gammaproteobacteria bacterium]